MLRSPQINGMRTAIRSSSSSLTSGGPIKVPIGGKIVITGIGEVEEDEFTLQLLNEQVKNISNSCDRL